MPKPKTSRILAGLAAGLLLAVLAVSLMRATRQSGSSLAGSDEFESDQTPLGGLLEKASLNRRLKQRMGELRAVWPAMGKFAEAHAGLLPTNVVALRPYLPADLAGLSDERWEMPSGGMIARPLMSKNDAILLQQKNVPPDRAKIVVYGDGHIEYKK
jgi:hypothetical protein